mmetsp:Transcript_112408/g.210806  ORF Transcript_112408/g.210806 Transcript_112408/m.210806 type:complete len:243 (+) Transcript_112408:388-1116(+)
MRMGLRQLLLETATERLPRPSRCRWMPCARPCRELKSAKREVLCLSLRRLAEHAVRSCLPRSRWLVQNCFHPGWCSCCPSTRSRSTCRGLHAQARRTPGEGQPAPPPAPSHAPGDATPSGAGVSSPTLSRVDPRCVHASVCVPAPMSASTPARVALFRALPGNLFPFPGGAHAAADPTVVALRLLCAQSPALGQLALVGELEDSSTRPLEEQVLHQLKPRPMPLCHSATAPLRAASVPPLSS